MLKKILLLIFISLTLPSSILKNKIYSLLIYARIKPENLKINKKLFFFQFLKLNIFHVERA